MRETKVQFSAKSDKFFGMVLERIVRNEAVLRALTIQIAKLRAAQDGLDLNDVLTEIAADTSAAYNEFSAAAVARLTEDQAKDPLSDL